LFGCQKTYTGNVEVRSTLYFLHGNSKGEAFFSGGLYSHIMFALIICTDGSKLAKFRNC